MKVYPSNYIERNELNLRHGIKSSLGEIKEVFALTFALYMASGKNSVLNYCNETNKQNSKIEIDNQLYTQLELFFGNIITNKKDFKNKINENPLFTSQIESLQVGLELFWKLAKILFIQNPTDNTRERTGGNRFAKQLCFSTNIIIIEKVLSGDDGIISLQLKEILFNWIMQAKNFKPNTILLDKIQTVLTIFSEETQFKMRKSDSTELYFQQEGIYKELVKNNSVQDKDSVEPVGAFRILKSFIKADLHKFIREDTNNGFDIKISIDVADLSNYNKMVNASLNLIPKRTVIYEELLVSNTFENNFTTDDNLIEQESPRQIIFFGSPGTGKSTEVKNRTLGKNIIRTTFHPEADYQNFVGCYKPMMNGDKIRYEFVPQAFTNAYCNAWLTPTQNHYLIIEEINRGNCAQIFGDIFQCLDRNAQGFSEYPVDCSQELATHIEKKFEKNPDAQVNYLEHCGGYHKLVLPNNLYIFATMNTSDQSLFPMDSAFKRRWDWEFVPINYKEAANLTINIDENNTYNWGDFISIINPKIKELTGSEDKQLGNYFISPADKIISFEQFRSKVMFYLWSEVYKDEVGTQNSIFKSIIPENVTKDFQFGELFSDTKEGITPQQLLAGFMLFNGIPNQKYTLDNFKR